MSLPFIIVKSNVTATMIITATVIAFVTVPRTATVAAIMVVISTCVALCISFAVFEGFPEFFVQHCQGEYSAVLQ